MRILIALLGDTPGAVTGVYYALSYANITIDRVVTITTRDADRAEDCVAREFERCRERGQVVTYAATPDEILPAPEGDLEHEPSAIKDYHAKLREGLADMTRVRIPYEDVNAPPAVACFREVLRVLLVNIYRHDEVHLSIAGGRKSMAALATLTAQLYGYSVEGLYHLWVQERIDEPSMFGHGFLRPEEDGNISQISNLPEPAKLRLLHPLPSDVQLVPLSFFQVTTEDGRPIIKLRGQMQEFLVEYLRENDHLMGLVSFSTRGKVLEYVFEEKVAEWLSDRKSRVNNADPPWDKDKIFIRAKPKWLTNKSDEVDVMAESATAVLICECKFIFDNENGDGIEAKGFKQVAKLIKDARKNPDYAGKQIIGRVVTPASQAKDAGWAFILGIHQDYPDIKVEFWQVTTDFQQDTDDWWITRLRNPWIKGWTQITETPPHVQQRLDDLKPGETLT